MVRVRKNNMGKGERLQVLEGLAVSISLAIMLSVIVWVTHIAQYLQNQFLVVHVFQSKVGVACAPHGKWCESER